MKNLDDNNLTDAQGQLKVTTRLLQTAPWLLSDYESPTWRVYDSYGKTVTIYFDEALPDGTFLSDSVNHHWLETIRYIAFSCRSGKSATINNGAQQASLVKAFVQLVSWMILNGLYRFSTLDSISINRYLRACSRGYEECLDTVGRIERAMESLLIEGVPLESISVKAAFTCAGIPWSRNPKMPRTKAHFSAFKMRTFNFQKKFAPHSYEANPSKVGDSGKLPELEPLRKNTLYGKARPIELLWQLKAEISDPLDFEPFPNGLVKYLKKIGKDGGHTKTIPVATAFFLAERATEWVLKIGPSLLDLRATLHAINLDAKGNARATATVAALKEFNGSEAGELVGMRVVLKKNKGEDTVTLHTLLNCYLPTACYIVIAILTARRNIEISNLEVNPITGSIENGLWLRSLIAKTLRRFDYTPCPKLVASAVAIMDRLRSVIQGKEEINRLFITPVINGKTKTYTEFSIKFSLQSFARFVKVPKIEREGVFYEWKFAPHQFRRIFAILFVWRFERGDLGALSYHLRHFNIRMTMVYVRDTEMRRILGEEYHRLTVEKLKSIEGGDIQPTGTFGKSLNRLIERMRKSVDIMDSTDMERKIIRMVEDRNLNFKGTPWGYCGASSSLSNIRRSNCQREENSSRRLQPDGSPDTSGSDETTCAGCFFHFTDNTKLEHWAELERDLTAKVENLFFSKIIRNVLASRLAVIKSFLRNSL